MQDGVEVIKANAQKLRCGMTDETKLLIADTFIVIAMEIEAANKRWTDDHPSDEPGTAEGKEIK